jgi:hypothetical protein
MLVEDAAHHLDHGYRTMLYPKVVGQSGTARPARYWYQATRQDERAVAPAVTTAMR